MEIRFAKAQDVPGMIKLLQHSGKVHHAGRPDLFRTNAQKYGPSQLLGMLDKADAPMFVAVEAEKVLGYGICRIEVFHLHSVMKDCMTLTIDDLYVQEDGQDRQIATALYQRMAEYAKYRGCYNMTMNAWCCDESTMKFCESLGMKSREISMEAIL